MLLVCCGEPEFATDEAFAFRQPANFPAATYTFENNPVTEEGFKLGKKLFFDPLLSRDGSVACSNCHQQGTAFADSRQHPFSVGVDDKVGTRNAPSLANLAFMPEFFWDGGVTHLDFVPLNALESQLEMDEQLPNILRKLNADDHYRSLFKQAFAIDEITSPYLLHALSQFTLMMVSANSRYDKFVRGEGEKLTENELQGLALFEQKCSDCHSGELFTDFSYRNNGLDETFADEGRSRITESQSDLGKFRVPGLRNVELTAPYMHDARYGTLEEVLDHYTERVVISTTLDPIFLKNGKPGIPLSSDEKEQIIAFLKTLTDREFTTDSRFFNSN